jgi:predicted nucleotidyltransferase
MQKKHVASLNALFPKTRQAILAATYLDSRRWWYMRELARHLRVAPSSLQRELDSLVHGKILRQKREGRRVYFQAATDLPVFAELRGLLLKTAGRVEVLRNALAPFGARIAWAFIYGSVAPSEEQSASDVGVMIVGRVRLAELSGPLRKAGRKLNRPVKVTVYTPYEFARNVKRKQHFITTVLCSKKLFVRGDPREFDEAFGRGGARSATQGGTAGLGSTFRELLASY